MRGRAPLEEELEVTPPDEARRWVHHQIVPLDDGVAIAVRDTTARHEAEADLHRREEQVRQSQKMEAIGRLAGGVAHDFNNLLTVIRGHGELVVRKLAGDHPLRHNLLEIGLAAERASALTHQLLAFSRKQVLQPRTLDLGEIVERMSTLLQRLIGRRRGAGHAPPRPPRQRPRRPRPDGAGDRQPSPSTPVTRLPRGGVLDLELANVELDETFAHGHPGMVPGGYVVLSVTDNGHGMTRTPRPASSSPSSRPRGGQGHGPRPRHRVRHREAERGGSSGSTASPGGAPRSRSTSRAWTSRPSSCRRGRGRPRSTGRRPSSSSRTKARCGRSCGSCWSRSATACWRRATERMPCASPGNTRGPIQLLLTDLVMPQMTGRELADRLGRLRPDLKVLFMSGYVAGAVPRHEVPSDGAYIEKPFTADAMGGAIRALLDPLTSSAS